MNAFLIISGSLIVALLTALWIVKQFNIQTKLWGVPLKYIIDIVLLIIAVVVTVILKTALANKSKALEALLMKLRISQANNNINIINDHLTQNQKDMVTIDSQISNLQSSSCSGQIETLTKQKEVIQKQIDDLNSKKQSYADNKSDLEDRVKKMGDLLNG